MSDFLFVLFIALILTGAVQWSNFQSSTTSLSPDKLLFTPGPLTTSTSVKSVINRDLGSREPEFMSTISNVRNKLLSLANTTEHQAILIPGSGTYALESVLSSLPCRSKVLVLVNGVYGQRLVNILKRYHISTVVEAVPEGQPLTLNSLTDDITAVVMVHCETSTGQINDVNQIGKYLKTKHSPTFIVDAMSSFGALPLDIANIHFLITSSNKCIQGLPGLSIVLASNDKLESMENSARSYSLDLYAFWKSFNTTGQFRFTPPVQILLALNQALLELEQETISKRYERYQRLSNKLVAGMKVLGFKPFIESPIIISFFYPNNDTWSFDKFYQHLYNHNMVIYPGVLSKTPTFRIGTIGNLNEDNIQRLLNVIAN